MNYSYRSHRNGMIKNVIITILAIAVLVLLAYSLRGCDFSAFTTSNQVPSNNSEILSYDSCTCTPNSNGDVIVNNLNCTCGNKSDDFDRDDWAARVAELQKENNKYKAEIETLRSAIGKSDVDLSNYVLKSEYDKLANSYSSLENKYNTLVITHNNCKDVDLSKYVKKSDYDALKKLYDEIVSKYNELVKKYNDFYDKWHNHKCSTDHTNCVSKTEYDKLQKKYNDFYDKWHNHVCSGGTTVVEADHSNCVSKSKYDKLEKDFNDFKANHTNCVSKSEYNRVLELLKQWENHVCSGGTTVVDADHSSCVSLSDYRALLNSYNDLEDKYNALLDQWNSHTCSGGTTVVEADHSSCVSLSDYKELLARYNALLEQSGNNVAPIYVDEDGNERP